MKFSLGQAAKHSGFSKPTLSRAIKSGKISATRLDDGSFAIDPAELERWKDNNGHRNHPETRLATPNETPETLKDSSSIQVEVEVLRERLRGIEEERHRERAQLERERSQLVGQVEDLQKDRDHWREQAEQAIKLLPAPASPAVSERPKRRWWHFGKANS